MSRLTLERAKEILPKHTTEEHLFIHAAAVSACMEGMAAIFGEEADYYRAIGYLHDVDYEKYPSIEEHCHHVRELLGPEDVDEEDIEVIISHGYGITTDEVKPESNVAKSLFTVDELSGIILANAKMRPMGMDGMTVQSFKKKFKDKKFAAGCSREVIDKGVEMLGLEPDVVMQACIDGMTAHKNELGLKA
jgi:predicted hydrolase (HD superfamily)